MTHGGAFEFPPVVARRRSCWATAMDLPPYLNALTGQIIGAAIEVHRHLGPGLLESSYTRCLHHELRSRHIKFVEERAVPLAYKGLVLDASYRVDLLVEDAVIVELKCVEA